MIYIILSSNSVGGAEKSLSLLGSNPSISNNKGKVSIVILEKETALEKFLIETNKNYVILPFKNLPLFLRLFLFLNRIPKCSIIYLIGLRLSFYIRLFKGFKIVSSKLILIHGIRWCPNNMKPSKIDLFFKYSEPFLANFTDFWITNSKKAQEYINKNITSKKDKVFVIYNTISKDYLSHKEDFKLQKEIITQGNILHVANVTKRKGHKEFIKNVLPLIDSDFVYTSIGNNFDNKLFKELSTNTNKNIIFKGEIDPSLIINFYKKADFCVLPSITNEGCPTVILEAMAMGKPTIAFAIDGIPELLNPFPELLVNPYDYTDFSRKVNNMLNKPSLCKNLSRRLYLHAREKYNEYEFFAKHQEIFHNQKR